MSLQVVVDFQVIDETEDWIVVDKPAPLIVHPANNKPEPTLLGGLESLLSYEVENGATLGIITRLDRETSGVVLVAKHTAAARELGMMFERREVKKEYLAIIHGWPSEDEWLSDGRICRAGDLGKTDIWVKQVVDGSGKDCETGFLVEKRFSMATEKYSVVRCFPKTGRMHQIRVHLAYAGHPIVGDKLYSGDGAEYLKWMETGWSKELGEILFLPRQALHAAKLSIPWRGEEIYWESQIASDLQAFIDGLPAETAENVVIWSRSD
ncbi:RluA family pseudouridine synthase [Luteolibacter sp. AS25]|uniref:RluA family pseudouridine synthase n=1 Tax=Luteolibacter sp. AS25 TaxID=3135776 RepID=UPI00398ADE65